MNPVRFMTFHGIAYLFPLSAWLTAQLTFIQGSVEQVQSIFHQVIVLSIAAQMIGMALLFARTQQNSVYVQINAGLLLLLFPLPLWTLGWLSASVEPISLGKALLLVTMSGAAAHGLNQVIIRLVARPVLRDGLIGAAQIILLMAFWHFRPLWLDWCGL